MWIADDIVQLVPFMPYMFKMLCAFFSFAAYVEHTCFKVVLYVYDFCNVPACGETFDTACRLLNRIC